MVMLDWTLDWMLDWTGRKDLASLQTNDSFLQTNDSFLQYYMVPIQYEIQYIRNLN
jgi:hypothetical protein